MNAINKSVLITGCYSGIGRYLANALQKDGWQVIAIFKRNQIGRIVNISSINGRVSFPYMGAYSASKFALEALSDALRIELVGTGIKVSIIEPGTIETNFRKNAVCRNLVLKDKKGNSPNIIFEKVRHALESKNPKARYLAGNGYIVYLKQYLPAKLFDIVMRFAIDNK